MPRPIKWRRVENIPEYEYFKPAGVPACDLKENVLKIEELEAVRLKDLEELDQESCAKKMEVSRQTFQRIYNSAKKKIADSLVNGKAISVKGGNFTQNICKLVCEACGHIWEVRVEDMDKINEGESQCPECNAEGIYCESKARHSFCGGRCRNRKRGQGQ